MTLFQDIVSFLMWCQWPFKILPSSPWTLLSLFIWSFMNIFFVFVQSLSPVWLGDPKNCSTQVLLSFTISRSLLNFIVSDAIQPSHPLLPPSPCAFNISLYRDLFQWVGSSHQVAKVLAIRLQHQSFQWIFRVDFLMNILWSKLKIIPISSPWSPDTVKLNRSNT